MEVDKRLLDLTNEFLEKFFEMANVVDGKTRQKDNDSFVFHFTLSDALIQSDHYQNDKEHNDSYGAYLCMSALSTNLAQAELEHRTKNFFPKILTIINNPEKCISDRSLVQIISDTIESKEFAESNWIGNKFVGFENVTREYRKVKLNIWNTTNSMNLILDVVFSPKRYDVIDEILVYYPTNPTGLILIKSNSKTEIRDIRAIRDVNGLFSAVNTIMFSIEYPEEM